MRRSRLFGFLALTWIAIAQQPADPASVTGTVSNSFDGKPVAHAHVSLHLGPQAYGALTDADGHFSIERLSAGQYSVSADAPGFAEATVIPGRPSAPLRLTAGQRATGVIVKLNPLCSISGRVLDTDGKPVQGVQVAILSADGIGLDQTTDPLGEFRIGGLRAGKYRVRAVPKALMMAPEIRDDGSKETRRATTYYPSSLTLESSAVVILSPGAEQTGVDVRLVPVPVVAVRGKVLGLPAGMEPGSLSVRKVELPRAPNTGRGSMSIFGRTVNADGTFTIWGLDPGRYNVAFESNGAGWESSPAAVTIGDRDVDGVMLQAVQEADIEGALAAADTSTQLPRGTPGASMGATPQVHLVELNGGSQDFSLVAGDASFHLTRVQPGLYLVRSPSDTYVVSMRAGSTDITGAVLDLRNGWTGGKLTLNISASTGSIRGVVQDSAGPLADVRVQLITEEDLRFDPTVYTLRDGSYFFDHLAPGKYRLVVLDRDVQYGMAIRHELVDYRDILETVELAAGESATRDLRAHNPGERK